MAPSSVLRELIIRKTDFFCDLIVTGQGRMNCLKLIEWKFRLDINKNFFSQGVVRQWRRTPREVVDFPSPEALKTRLDGDWGNLIWWVATPHTGAQ